MEKSQLLFESSPWLILVALALGFTYAFLQYQKPGPWNQTTRRLLAGIRFVLVSLLAIIVLGPFIRQIQNITEPPVIVVGFDNSTSMMESSQKTELSQVVAEIEHIAANLVELGFEVDFRSFDNVLIKNPSEQLSFDFPSTNLHQLLNRIQSDYEGRNVSGVILVSDGIYNQGISPVYTPFNFVVHSVGLGDTIGELVDEQFRAVHLQNDGRSDGHRIELEM